MITLGPFAVGSDGTLSPRSPGSSPELRFAWRGRDCRALVTERALQLRAMAGRIPSTADRHADRAATLRAVAALPLELPAGWRLRLTADHRLALEMEAPPGATAVALLGDMVRFAMAMDPYLDRLEAAGA
ncbi:hypothetical protein [Roseococcus pinisoli]|uniref:Uncharacterized protein n=1 Tax=Roseococcus pinisoli TaxID=2835040 RepID=A0ABS5QEN4_9PROT|nr:hypothetical protein [Roseococcus pinisoli]MBS7812155.1 hypothetical protein [Roseococcus pinisoli]